MHPILLYEMSDSNDVMSQERLDQLDLCVTIVNFDSSESCNLHPQINYFNTIVPPQKSY